MLVIEVMCFYLLNKSCKERGECTNVLPSRLVSISSSLVKLLHANLS